MPTSVHAQEFQPHPSHAPPPPPATPPPPSPAPRIPPPKKISGEAPEFPERARRFNAQGSVTVKLTVGPNGKVQKTDIIAGTQIFADSVKRAVKKWRFEQRPAASDVRLRIPFTLVGKGEYALDTTVRRMLHTPTDPAEIKQGLTFGFAYVRLLIDASGNVVDTLPMSCEPEHFKSSWEAIVATLKFAPSAVDARQPRSNTVNEVLIDYANDGKIRVQHRGGD